MNEYAPFYLWDDAGAAAAFLWGGEGFGGLVRDFGRPTVQTWVPTAYGSGQAHSSDVTHAVLRTQQIAGDADLVATAAQLREDVAARAADSRTHLAFAGIDPTTWQSAEFCTITAAESSDVAPRRHGADRATSQPGRLRGPVVTRARTVLGDVAPDRLGVTNSHDHLFFRSAALPGVGLRTGPA